VKTRELFDRLAIRELLDNWVIWRDSGQWDRLATAFHREGWMVATWQTAPADAFVAGCRAAWDKGVKCRIPHLDLASIFPALGQLRKRRCQFFSALWFTTCGSTACVH
jgi:hypothetical protein